MIPYPFSRGVYWFGEPLYVPQDADDAIFEQKRLELEKRLNDITEKADAFWNT